LKLIVPQRASTVMSAENAAGAPAARMPSSGISSRFLFLKASGVAAPGAAMLPLTEMTRDSPAGRSRIGHSPPMVCICGLTSPSTSVAAIAASKALPPPLRMSTAAFTDRYEFAATAPCVPIRRG
jgi:hypothetical protein